MTDEKRTRFLGIVSKDTNEQLLARYTWYVDNFNPLDDDMCAGFEIIKAEILRRMEV